MLGGTERRPSAVPVMGLPLDNAMAGARRNSPAQLSLPQQNKAIYRFEELEVNCSQGCLKRGGSEQYVRQQSFQVLLYLLEQRHRLVTKEELIGNFWQHTAVTDNAIVQCIADVRKVLGDDSRHPRFVKTVPKVGYRFIGCVEEEYPKEFQPAQLGEIQWVTESRDSNQASTLAEAQQAARAGNSKQWRGKAIAFLALTAAVSIVCFVALRYWNAKRVDLTLPRIPGRKAVAVMYFEDQSGRPDLSWLREGLADMFITNLSQSGKLTVLSRQQLQILVERTHLTRSDIRIDDALDMARRSRAEAVILGSFAALGEGLLINVQMYGTSHGQLLASDRLIVNQVRDILAQIDLVSIKMTSRLGVAPREKGAKTSLAEVMTKSFEAYRYYSLGVGKAQAFENAEAVGLLQKAIQLDPNFAMAYARIGYAYSVTDFLANKGKPYLEKAFHLSDRLTDKDKLYIAAWYAIAREDYANAIRMFRQIIAEYPMETEAYARLARLLYREERPLEAISIIQQGLATDSEATDLYNVLGICFLGLSRYDDAVAAHQRYVALAPKQPNAHDSLGMSYQQWGKYAEAESEYKAALLLNSRFEPAIIHLGDLYSQQGCYRDAVRQYSRYIQVTRSGVARAVGYGSIAQLYWRKRDFVRGEEAAHNETRYQKGAVWNSLLFALERGNAAKAANLKERLFENLPYPERGVRHELRSYDYRLGILALKQNRLDQAIAHFKKALQHLPPSSGLDLYEDCLANAYLESGRLDEAINEYARILRTHANYPLAEYHLAEAYERKGERTEAGAAYERFLQNWKHADSDIPEIENAKKKISTRLARNAVGSGG
jgi:tetratricopeptide (TPR) repeat protein/DNA-binding winged helix-turn-helix (wHTH) protein/TolB-like protein